MRYNDVMMRFELRNNGFKYDDNFYSLPDGYELQLIKNKNKGGRVAMIQTNTGDMIPAFDFMMWYRSAKGLSIDLSEEDPTMREEIQKIQKLQKE